MPRGTTPPRIPIYVLVVAVLAAGGGTAWAMWQTQLGGPFMAYEQASGTVDQVWAGQVAAGQQQAGMPLPPASAVGAAPMPSPAPQQIPGNAGSMANAPPGPGAASSGGTPADPYRPVAGLPGVPVITQGSARPHPDRGVCTKCHTVVRGNGNAMPIIHSFSSMPHGFRGLCHNCHTVTVGGGGRQVAMATPQMGGAGMGAAQGWSAPGGGVPQMGAPQAPMAAPQGQVGAQQWSAQIGGGGMSAPIGGGAAQARPTRPPPNEADWRGMEVRSATQGVVVTNAEGTAARMGVQPGDVVLSINGSVVNGMNDFVGTTQNGRLPNGTVIVRRNGERLAFELAQGGAGQTAPSMTAPGAQGMPGPGTMGGFQGNARGPGVPGF